jgi:hypothetical protein
MSGNPREHAKDKGFWDGGSKAHNSGNQAAGRNSGFPGSRRRTSRVGVRSDLEAPTTVKPAESPLGRSGK